MTEWGVVGVVIALIGLVASVTGPVIKLNPSITKLTVTLTEVEKRLKDQEEHSRESHKRIWHKNEEQDQKLENHEGRDWRQIESDGYCIDAGAGGNGGRDRAVHQIYY
mgnify:CR=1 FL=1